MKVQSLLHASGNKHCKNLQSQNKLPYLACKTEPFIFPKTFFAFRAGGLHRCHKAPVYSEAK